MNNVVNDPKNLLNRLLEEKSETSWIEYKTNNVQPDLIGKLISACSNAAILDNKNRAFIVFGIEDQTLEKVGTDIKLKSLKKGNENLINWLTRMINPNLMIEFIDFEEAGKKFSIISIDPTYERPVQFSGEEYIRIGENIKKLKQLPEYERSLWLATSRRKFEDALAATNLNNNQIFKMLDIDSYYNLSALPKPNNENEILRHLCQRGFILEDMEGGYNITNLGAILIARKITDFPTILNKSIRVIKYTGVDKRKSDWERSGEKGYAVGFSGLLDFIMQSLPSEEIYIRGVRSMRPLYPEIALREIIANALIHQDFTIKGSSPVIEIYSDRIEILNPGNSLIEIDRIIDERLSRNEKLASVMRSLGLCEERGGGIDKALIEIEEFKLPPFKFIASENSMRVTLYGPREFQKITKSEKLRACYFHCVLKWLNGDNMSNSSLRNRFSLEDKSYKSVSVIIAEAIKNGRIKPEDPQQSNRFAKYIPYWATN